MHQTPLQTLDLHELYDVIRAGLASSCENSGHKSLDITPLGYEESELTVGFARAAFPDMNRSTSIAATAGMTRSTEHRTSTSMANVQHMTASRRLLMKRARTMNLSSSITKTTTEALPT
ncbi:hypothetical protein BIV09_13880 [Pseudomonas sp. 7SR1]|nr:hypothetical protein BIV09_13880 [Pseudomonas sp. 7SR1]